MPTQIGAGNDSGVTLYYVPPPDQGANVFTSFWAGFLSERMPIAKEVFAARLAQMQPADYTDAILEYDKLIADRAKQIEETAVSAMRSNTDIGVALIGYEKGVDIATRQQSGQSARLERSLAEKRRLEATLEEGQLDLVEGFRMVSSTPGASPQALQAELDAAIRGLDDANPGQRSSASRYLARAIDNVDDPVLQDQLRVKVLQRLGAPGAGPEDGMPSAYGGGSAGSRERVAEIGRAYGVGGAPRAGGGTFATPDQEYLGVASTTAPRASAGDDAILADLYRRRDALIRDDGRTPIIDFQAPIIGGPDASVFVNAYLRTAGLREELGDIRRGRAQASATEPPPTTGSVPKSEPPAKAPPAPEPEARPESMAPPPARQAPPRVAPRPEPQKAPGADENSLLEAATDPDATRAAMRDFAQRTARQEAPDVAPAYSPAEDPNLDLRILQSFTEEMRQKRERDARWRATHDFPAR